MSGSEMMRCDALIKRGQLGSGNVFMYVETSVGLGKEDGPNVGEMVPYISHRDLKSKKLIIFGVEWSGVSHGRHYGLRRSL